MVGAMRIARLSSGIAVVLLAAATLAPAEAQSQMRPVSDAKGLFSISLPPDWHVANSKQSDVVFGGLRNSGVGQYIVSTLAAHSSEGDSGPAAILAVAAVALPVHISPAAFGDAMREKVPSGWQVTQEGRATIAGRDAHYLYFVMNVHEYALYMVMAYFNVGRTGFLVMGGTLNEAEIIRKHFGTISQILETFHPSPTLNGSLRH